MSRNKKMKNLYPNEYEEEEDEEEFEEEEEEEVETKNITVKVKKAAKCLNNEICIKIDRDVELRWLMIHYCDKLGMNYGNTKFMFNGARIRDTDTPLQLSMLHLDVIYVIPILPNQVVHGRAAVCYKTLCIRMHKKRDTFVRVTRQEPLLGQLKRHFSNGRAGKHALICFVYNGLKLAEDSTVDKLNMKEGDIIDAFDFDETSSSLRIITPIRHHLTVKMRHYHVRLSFITVKGNSPARTLVHKFAESMGLRPNMLKLLFNGRHLSLDKTVEEQELFDGCLVDVIMTQTGG